MLMVMVGAAMADSVVEVGVLVESVVEVEVMADSVVKVEVMGESVVKVEVMAVSVVKVEVIEFLGVPGKAARRREGVELAMAAVLGEVVQQGEEMVTAGWQVEVSEKEGEG